MNRQLTSLHSVGARTLSNRMVIRLGCVQDNSKSLTAKGVDARQLTKTWNVASFTPQSVMESACDSKTVAEELTGR